MDVIGEAIECLTVRMARRDVTDVGAGLEARFLAAHSGKCGRRLQSEVLEYSACKQGSGLDKVCWYAGDSGETKP